jgi:hypothetical protein
LLCATADVANIATAATASQLTMGRRFMFVSGCIFVRKKNTEAAT